MEYTDILAIIYGSIIIIGIIVAMIFACWYDFKKTELRKDHIKTLNEHDKAVIMTFLAQKPNLERKKKNDKKWTSSNKKPTKKY